MKEQILKLHQQGKTYEQISDILGCAKSTISYHCNPQVKQNFLNYRNKNRKKQNIELKLAHGGKCQRCGYSKCLAALHFHHLDPKEKIGAVGELHSSKGKAAAHAEAAKCQLICANCHAEIHSQYPQ